MFKSTWDLAYDVKHNMGDTVKQLEADRDAMRTQLEAISKKLNEATQKIE